MLKRALYGILTESEIAGMYAAFDQIGHIIIVRIPESLWHKREAIGAALLEEVRPARTIYAQSSDVTGEYRTRALEVIAGADEPLTEYIEHGCRFLVNVKDAFFSPRLSAERLRIADMALEGEHILNMFGGIGMFSVIAAKRTKCHVYNMDLNPAASDLCEKNIERNKMAGTVTSLNGDAADMIRERFADASDRTLMLLPERSDEFLASAIYATKSGGIIHYYSHMHADSKRDAPKLSEEHYTLVSPVESEILSSRIVRAVGTRYYQTVVDARITKPTRQ